MDDIWEGYEEYYFYPDHAEMPGYCYPSHTWDGLEQAKWRLENTHRHTTPMTADDILDMMEWIKTL